VNVAHVADVAADVSDVWNDRNDGNGQRHAIVVRGRVGVVAGARSTHADAIAARNDADISRGTRFGAGTTP
jgi:hypothetical protein